MLHQVVVAHAETAFAEVRAASEAGVGFPRHVEREFRTYATCGILGKGFLRVRCDACGLEELVAFSCHGRGFCPACIGRRMADTSTRLVDEVLPRASYRQWVFTFPYRLRQALAFDKALWSIGNGSSVMLFAPPLMYRAPTPFWPYILCAENAIRSIPSWW